MFRYIFSLVLLNYSYRSLGVPVPPTAPVSLTNLLTVLSTSCENRFLVDQIKNKLSYCSDLSPPHGGKELECLIFYDINKQLCAAVGDSKLAITKDYSAKITEEQDVNILCGTTKDWVFTNIPGYTHYKSSVEKVFKHLVSCGKVCGVEELMSDDANFYCKYFKWGTDMLKTQVILPPTPENPIQSSSGTGNVENNPVNSAPNNQVNSAANDLDVQIKNSTLNTPNAPSEVASVKTEGTTKSEGVKPEAASENNQEPEPLSVNSASGDKSRLNTEKAEPLPGEEPVVPEVPVASDQADKPADPTSPELKNEVQNPESPDTTLTKPDSEDSKKIDVDKEIQLLNNELERKEPVLETPGQSKDKLPSDVDDYQDSDEGKDGLGDIQGDDDGDDAMIGDVNKINKPEDPKEEPKETPNLKTAVSGITGETGLYPSFGQDSYDDDNDDHFFSFFLTAVIMVVLIYVLYHNKSKVGKVFFGLVLEGRQSGRRRNSRGHAYKRLDTLEQAMSTNTAAPPSKIIY